MPSIISIVDNNAPAFEVDENIVLNKTSIDTYMEDFVNNFYKIKHGVERLKEIKELYEKREAELSISKTVEPIVSDNSNNSLHIMPSELNLPKLLASNPSIKPNKNKLVNVKDTGAQIGCLGTSFNLGLPPAFNKNFVIKTGTFGFPVNINVSIPAFTVYDSDVGLDLIDYLPEIDTDCNYLPDDDDETINVFPGLPCNIIIEWCKKCVNFRVPVINKKIRLCSPPYPCGIKIKTIGSISLEKANLIPAKLFEFNGFGLSFNGTLKNSWKFGINLTSNIPIKLFLKCIKQYSLSLYNTMTRNGTLEPPTRSDALDVLMILIKSFQDLISLGYVISNMLNTVVTGGEILYFNVALTSIKVNVEFNLNYFGVNYGSDSYNITDLSETVTDYELLRDGKYISFYFSAGISGLALTAQYNIITAPLVDIILNPGNLSIPGKDIVDLVLVMLNNKMLKSANDQATFQKIKRDFDHFTNVKALINDAVPGFSTIVNRFSPIVSFGIGVCISPGFPVTAVGITTIQLQSVNVIKFIKDFLVDIFLDFVTGEYFLKLSNSLIDNIPSNLGSIKSTLRRINGLIDRANDLYRGLLELALAQGLNFLESLDFPETISPTMYYITPLVPA